MLPYPFLVLECLAVFMVLKSQIKKMKCKVERIFVEKKNFQVEFEGLKV